MRTCGGAGPGHILGLNTYPGQVFMGDGTEGSGLGVCLGVCSYSHRSEEIVPFLWIRAAGLLSSRDSIAWSHSALAGHWSV